MGLARASTQIAIPLLLVLSAAQILKAIEVRSRLVQIPENYDKTTAPPLVDGKPNIIKITADIFSIPDFDEKDEEIMLEVRITHTWKDIRLNTSLIFDTETKTGEELDPSAISQFWVPDSYFHHAKDAKFIKLMTHTASLNIRRDKTIRYSTMVMLTIGCPMKFHNYPMDTQTCRLALQSFGYDLNHNFYQWLRPPRIRRDINLDNHEIKMTHFNFTYSSEGKTYPGLGIKLNLHRHLGYHLTQTYVPSILFVFTAWISFFVPSDVVPGRMVICVTTLLTLTSMFSSVRALTPQVSYMKAIDLWVLICLLLTFTCLAEYGIILHMTSRSGWQKKMDEYVRTVSGKPKLRKVSAMEMGPLSLRKHDRRMSIDSGLPTVKEDPLKARQPPRDPRHPSRELRKTKSAFIIINPEQGIGQPNGVATGLGLTIPKEKLRLAYTMEFYIKIIYPLIFIIFNISYWSYYLLYASS